MSYQFTTIIKKEGKWYVARCAELGVVSQGKTIEEAKGNVKEASELYLEGEPETAKQFSKEPAFITTFELKYA
ncbi:MAG: type II toxin-antitoxin system HicB family antitoxin [Candidatus Omnitrophota bacterium]|nr:type II toxin-antitoxin system HicB family antitoxin [Candidatus Omnitrophota bacterium]